MSIYHSSNIAIGFLMNTIEEPMFAKWSIYKSVRLTYDDILKRIFNIGKDHWKLLKNVIKSYTLRQGLKNWIDETIIATDWDQLIDW